MRRFALAALAASIASAQTVIESASFGHNDRISPNTHGIPSWHISGENDWRPELLSNRVVLTPPAPGDRRGALWMESPLTSHHWKVDMEFRASGAYHAGGNLQIWYTKQGQGEIGTNNVYTVGNFEGLVVVVDQGSSGGGGIRAFLNDGKEHYASHAHIDGLAFAHCDYNYRNLGRPSKITLQQDSEGFQLLVDDHGCFRSNSIELPSNNYFGVTATSSQTPDSFEVWKFITTGTPDTPHSDFQQRKFGEHQEHQEHQEAHEEHEHHEHHEHGEEEGDLAGSIDDSLASTIRDQQAQFADLHNRVQMMGHSVENLFREITRHSQRLTERLEQVTAPLAKDRQMQMIDTRLANLESKLNQLKADQKDWTGHFNDIHKSLKARHDALLQSVPESVSGVIASKAPNMGLFLFLLVAFQLMMAAAYVVYKRRLSQGPKKYL